jgi:hypothetical protein
MKCCTSIDASQHFYRILVAFRSRAATLDPAGWRSPARLRRPRGEVFMRPLAFVLTTRVSTAGSHNRNKSGTIDDRVDVHNDPRNAARVGLQKPRITVVLDSHHRTARLGIGPTRMTNSTRTTETRLSYRYCPAESREFYHELQASETVRPSPTIAVTRSCVHSCDDSKIPGTSSPLLRLSPILSVAQTPGRAHGIASTPQRPVARTLHPNSVRGPAQKGSASVGT